MSNNITYISGWLSFWDAAKLSKEDDILECEAWYTRIVNNGGVFKWEESWETVKLDSEFMGMKWRVISKNN